MAQEHQDGTDLAGELDERGDVLIRTEEGLELIDERLHRLNNEEGTDGYEVVDVSSLAMHELAAAWSLLMNVG